MLTALAARRWAGTWVRINTTRRGDGLARRRRASGCNLLTDAEHRHLLDGLDLPGVSLSTRRSAWSQMVAEAPVLTQHREVGPNDTS